MRIVLLVALVVSLGGCSRMGPMVTCSSPVNLAALGLSTHQGRIWRVNRPLNELGPLIAQAGRCFATRKKPIAFVSETGDEFLGIALTRGTPRRVKQPGIPVTFDTLDTNRNVSGSTSSCRPGDLADLRESHKITAIEGRRITTEMESPTNDELKYASVWLWRCVRAVDPIGWVTPDGELIAVYRRKQVDRFE